MKLSECSIGMIVQEKYMESAPSRKRKIGYISGLTENNVGEVIPLVQFADESIDQPCHHGNLVKYIEE